MSHQETFAFTAVSDVLGANGKRIIPNDSDLMAIAKANGYEHVLVEKGILTEEDLLPTEDIEDVCQMVSIW